MTSARDAVPFVSIPPRSRTAHPLVNTAHRLDPYWGADWGYGTQTTWFTYAQFAARESQHPRSSGRMYAADRQLPPTRAREILQKKGAFFERRLKALAAVGMWRTPSAEQIAAIVGAPQLAHHAEDLRAAYSLGLVNRGLSPTAMVREPRELSTALYKPITSRRADAFFAGLSVIDKLALGVAQPHRWEAGSQADRHNLLTTELALRIAEFCDVGAVLGERGSGIDELLARTWTRTELRKKAADATVVRDDGMRIAIELTANANQGTFVKKVDAWVQVLDGTEDDGLSVLFVEAARVGEGLAVSNKIRKAIESALSDVFVSRRSAVAQRIAVVTWQDWFPTANHASVSLVPLRSFRPTGPRDDRWQPVDLLDVNQLIFEPKDEFAAMAALERCHIYWGMPHWLRNENMAANAPLQLLMEYATANGLTLP